MEPTNLNHADRRFVEIFNLIKAYPNPYGDPVRVIDGFDLVMRKGEVISIIGHSGCGKSTVLTMLAGLNEISGGSIAVGGREIDGPGPDRSVVFQSPCLLPWLSTLDNVLLGVNQVFKHGTKKQRLDIAKYYLDKVGLSDSLDKFPREMSGGMQQRVGIARAIALKPRVLLLDEPFGRLDSLTRMDLQDVILKVLNQEKITTMIITHDVDEAIYMSDRVCMMTNGPNARVGQLLDLPFEHPRVRAEVMEHPLYYELRGALVSFLEQQDHSREPQPSFSEKETRWDDTHHMIEAINDTLPHFAAQPEPATALGMVQAGV